MLDVIILLNPLKIIHRIYREHHFGISEFFFYLFLMNEQNEIENLFSQFNYSNPDILNLTKQIKLHEREIIKSVNFSDYQKLFPFSEAINILLNAENATLKLNILNIIHIFSRNSFPHFPINLFENEEFILFLLSFLNESVLFRRAASFIIFDLCQQSQFVRELILQNDFINQFVLQQKPFSTYLDILFSLIDNNNVDIDSSIVDIYNYYINTSFNLNHDDIDNVSETVSKTISLCSRIISCIIHSKQEEKDVSFQFNYQKIPIIQLLNTEIRSICESVLFLIEHISELETILGMPYSILNYIDIILALYQKHVLCAYNTFRFIFIEFDTIHDSSPEQFESFKLNIIQIILQEIENDKLNNEASKYVINILFKYDLEYVMNMDIEMLTNIMNFISKYALDPEFSILSLSFVEICLNHFITKGIFESFVSDNELLIECIKSLVDECITSDKYEIAHLATNILKLLNQ